MKKKTMGIIVILILSALPLFAAGTKENTQTVINENIIYLDSYNREVSVPKDINRVISLGPNLTEIIASLKAEALIARTDYCTFPESILDLPSVGKITEPNLERIIELQPDLVVGSTHVKKEFVENLEKASINTAVLYNSTSIEGSYKNILDLGILLNKIPESESIVSSMKEEIQYIQSQVKDLDRPKVYYVIGFGQYGEYTAGGDTFINEMINLAGGKNIAEEIKGWAFSLEKIIENDPDIIIISQYYGSKKLFETTEPYSDLRAVKEGHLYEINNDKLDRQGIRNSEGIMDLAMIIHPNAFK